MVGSYRIKGTAPARGLSPLARGRGATCQLRPPTPSQRRVSRSARAPALAVSREEAQHSSLLRARAVPRWLWLAYAVERALRRREASLLRRAAVVRRASCGLQRQASAACHARARLRSLSLGRRRSTRACYARAPCRAGCGRSMPLEETLRRREASLLRRAAVVRRASCGLQRQASFRVERSAARPALAVFGEEAQHSSLLRARAVPRWLWSARS